MNESDGQCPLCSKMFPMAKLCSHASQCNGDVSQTNGVKRKHGEYEEGSGSAASSFFNLKKRKSEPSIEKSSPNAKVLNVSPAAAAKPETVQKTTFCFTTSSAAPLAERMRPKDFSSYCGHESSLGENTVIRY